MVESAVPGTAARGPFTVRLKGDTMTIGQLKERLVQQMTAVTPIDAAAAADNVKSVEESENQQHQITGRWIIDRKLADDDTKTLAHYGLTCQEDAQRAGLIYFYILGTTIKHCLIVNLLQFWNVQKNQLN